MTIGRLRAGVAEVEITGAVGLLLAGDFTSRISTGVRTPLFAKALVLSNGDVALAVVTLDLFGLPEDRAEQLTQAIAERCHLKSEAVLIATSRTRGAPSTTPMLGSARTEDGYLDEIFPKVVETVIRAQEGMQNASVGVGQAKLPHLIYNHRLLTRNMKAISAWLAVPPNEVLEPEGPIDPEFTVLVVRDDRGFPFCLLWNFAAENRFSNGEKISADLPVFVQDEVDRRFGHHVPCLYLTGCGGDVSFVLGLEQVVDAVASAIIAVELETSCDPCVKLCSARERVILPVRDYSQFWSKADIELKYPQALDAYAREQDFLRQSRKQAVPTSVQVLRIGPFAVVGLPGMPFVEFATAIKKDSPARVTIVAGGVSADVGYVITRRAFQHGGFETWPSRASPVGLGGGEFMVERSIALVRALWRELVS